jgi:hypothetical protein
MTDVTLIAKLFWEGGLMQKVLVEEKHDKGKIEKGKRKINSKKV